MEAPTYPPAPAYEQPVAEPYVLSLETASIADLMQIPDAWAIVVKYLPSFKFMVSVPQAKPQLGNMTVPSMAAFTGPITAQLTATINEELGRLPLNQVTPHG